MNKSIKILIAKPGLDGHEAGARLIAKALCDAGMETIYLGIRQTPEMIVNAALQEDVSVIGLSILSGIHMEASMSVLRLLEENKAQDISVIVGGIIPHNDVANLKELGVKGVFGPGTTTDEVVIFIREMIK